MTTDKDAGGKPAKKVIGNEITDVEYTGDYHHPFRFVLDDGTEMMGAVRWNDD